MPRSQIDLESLNFSSRKLGPLPIINRFFDQLRLDRLLDEHVPHIDRRITLPPAAGLGVLVRNILVAREPLFSSRSGLHSMTRASCECRAAPPLC